jgi:hypothetical protein
MRFSRTQREAMNPAPTHEFFLLGGVVLALLFTAAIMMAGLSPLVLPMCA